MNNELKCTAGQWQWTERSEVSGVPSTESSIPFSIAAIFPGEGSFCAPIADICNFPPSTEENINIRRYDACLIAASKDLYNALNKTHSECHKLLNRGTNEKLSVIDCLTIIGAIGETCEKPLTKANPDFKP